MSHGKIYNLPRSRLDSGFSIERGGGVCWGFPNVCVLRAYESIWMTGRDMTDVRGVISLLQSGKGSRRETPLLSRSRTRTTPLEARGGGVRLYMCACSPSGCDAACQKCPRYIKMWGGREQSAVAGGVSVCGSFMLIWQVRNVCNIN